MVTAAFEEALAAATVEWMGKGGVVAVAQGEDAGEPTIELWATGEASASDFPERFRGFRLQVRDSGGPIQAQRPETQ